MNRCISGLLLSIFLLVPNGAAIAATDSTSADDQTTLMGLEVKMFTHPDTWRTDEARVINLESFVYGEPRKGSVHDRVVALAQAVAQQEASEKFVSERKRQIEQARQNLHPAISIPMQSVIPQDQVEITMLPVPHVHIVKKARIQHLVTVVDRIESLELQIFGHKECAKKLQIRVSHLEKSLFGTDYGSNETITARVNRLWTTYNGATPTTPNT